MNRNFGFKWAEGVNILDPRPASPLPCLDTYHGPNAFSEPETKAVRWGGSAEAEEVWKYFVPRDFVMSKRHRLTSYIAFHRYKIARYQMSPSTDVFLSFAALGIRFSTHGATLAKRHQTGEISRQLSSLISMSSSSASISFLLSS